MKKVAQPSVQSLLIKMQFDGQLLATGTGFVANSSKGPMLITNRHNVTGRDPHTNETLHPSGGIPNEIVIVHNRIGEYVDWIEKSEKLIINDKPCWYVHPELREKADFVAVPLTNLDDVQLYPYDFSTAGPEIAIGPSDSLSVVGFPFGRTAGGSFAIWATGFMASEPCVDFEGLPIFLIDCRTRKGQSGSPVIAFRNGGTITLENGSVATIIGPLTKFLGIYSGRINAESDLGFVWKSSAIQEMLDEI